MIKSLIDTVATKLVTLNTWLSEVRAGGYLQKANGDISIIDRYKNEIGITDKRGNSGYIRYRSDQNYTVQELPSSERYSSCEIIGQRIAINLRLILVVQSTIPEDIAFLLTVQMNSFQFDTPEFNGKNVRVRVQSAGTNTLANVLTETSQNDLNNDNEVIYIDFQILFDWNQRCDIYNIPIEMECNDCLEPLDLGCKQYCETLELSQVSTYTGIVTLKTMFNGVSIIRSIDVVDGESISIDLEEFTPDYEYSVSLYNVEGDLIPIQDESPTPVEYDCFKLKVTP